MDRTRKLLAAGAAATVLAAGGAAAAGAAGVFGGDDGEGTVSGPQADRATEAALAITGGGTAKSVEADGENGATWEVEVTKPDGQTVDVRLDDAYKLVTVEGDSESADEGGPGDDASE